MALLPGSTNGRFSVGHVLPRPCFDEFLRYQTRLEPKLEEEERRRTFDIHLYGEEVIGRVVEAARGTDATVPFSEAVRGLSVHDIGRSFLATLQLANDGNVVISLSGKPPWPHPALTAKDRPRDHLAQLTRWSADKQDRESILLSVVSEDSRHRAMVTDYVAPSLLSARKKRAKGGARVQVPRLELEAAPALAGVAPAVDWQGESTQASQAPTQEGGAGVAALQARKWAFAAVRGKENHVPRD